MRKLSIFTSATLGAIALAGSLPSSANAGAHIGAGINFLSGDELDSATGFDIEAAYTSRGQVTGTFGLNLQYYTFDDDFDLDLGEIEGFDLGELNVDAELTALPLLAFYRLAVPLGQGNPIAFYGELGAGTARLGTEVSGLGTTVDESTWAFAWAIGAGLTWDMTESFGVRAGYQYLSLGDLDIDGESFDAGGTGVIRVGAYLTF